MIRACVNMDQFRFVFVFFVASVVCFWQCTEAARDRRIYDQLHNFKAYVQSEVSFIKDEIRILFENMKTITRHANKIENNSNEAEGNIDSISDFKKKMKNAKEAKNQKLGCEILKNAFQVEKQLNRELQSRLSEVEQSISHTKVELFRNMTALSQELFAFLNKALESKFQTTPEESMSLVNKEEKEQFQNNLGENSNVSMKVDTTTVALLEPESCKAVPDDGVYSFYFEYIESRVSVYCDQSTDGGGWIVVMRRSDNSVDFNRPWADYKYGFGDRKGEFWAGNEFLHQLTKSEPLQLRIDMTDFNGNKGFAQYDRFQIGSETNKYKLSLGNYSGNLNENLMRDHNGMMFTTLDSDNDIWQQGNCASEVTGPAGWWFDFCYSTCLTCDESPGWPWTPSSDYHDLAFVEMKVR